MAESNCTPVSRSSNGTALYECVCPDCGLVRIQDKRKIGKPCHPCAQKRRATHGKSGTRVYRVWSGMIARCKHPSSSHYKYYGGRGISVCHDWQKFDVFYSWAEKNGYCDSLELDRIDPNGNYCPENCRFVTHQVNSQMRRRSKCTVEKAKEIKTLISDGVSISEAARRVGVPRMTAWHISKGNTWRNA